jgi:hypothetical protein
MQKPKETSPQPEHPPAPAPAQKPEGEIGGSGKPEPTRYGDWEIGGKCVDF